MHSHDTNKPVAEFQQEVGRILNGTSFFHPLKDRFDFTEFVFPKSDFRRATFTQNAYFHEATFTQNAYFGGATFTQNAYFHEATFAQDAKFGLATFTQDANFLGATFAQDAKFGLATFTQNAYFRKATFTQDADFNGATFTQDADFNGAWFTQDAKFSGAWFTQDADFNGATFTRNANFIGARFTQGADFGAATFTQDAGFIGARFTRNADFIGARFTQNASFRRATFSQKGLFDCAHFGAVADFRSASLERPSEVLFHRVNEGSAEGMRARFVNCLLEGVRFEDVNWHSEGGRLTLQDETDLRAKEEGATHELVSDSYRRLVNNFEKARQYELAEQCVIGEMEMRRLNPRNFVLGQNKKIAALYKKNSAARWCGEQLSVTNLYRLVSIYGSSYKRALAVLIVFLLAFALSFPVSGLRPAKDSDLRPQCPSAVPGSPEAEVISWGCAAAHPNRFREIWGTFKAGLWASVETATFQRARIVEPATGWGRALAVAEIIVVPGQLALFLLALRRRFRR